MKDSVHWKWGDANCKERMAVINGFKLYQTAVKNLCQNCEEKLAQNDEFFDSLIYAKEIEEFNQPELKNIRSFNLSSDMNDAILRALKAGEYDDDRHDDYGGCGSATYAVVSQSSAFWNKFPLANQLWRTIQMYGEDNAMKFVIPVNASNLLGISYV